MAALILAAFRAQDLPLIGGGDTYHAAFAESGGLKPNDEVRIAGVRVGKVESVELDGDHVKVTFRVDGDAEFGAETAAAIKVKTLLGAMFLVTAAGRWRPAGGGRGDPGRAHHLAVRRGRGLLRSRRDVGTDRHQPARAVADHPRRPDPEHSRGVPRGPRRRLHAVGERGRPRRTDQQPAAEPGEGVQRPRRARPGHHRADARLRRAVPGPGEAPRGRAQPAGLHLAAVAGADRSWSSRAARTSSRP